MEDLKQRVKDFEDRDIERRKEISDLNLRLEMLYATVEQLITVRKMKKRRKVKQHQKPACPKN